MFRLWDPWEPGHEFVLAKVTGWIAAALAVVLVAAFGLSMMFGDAGAGTYRSGTEVFAEFLHRSAERWADEASAERAAALPARAAASHQTLTARLSHVTAIVLPPPETLAEVVVGDAEQWEVSSTERMVFIRPLAAGAASNLLLLTAAGEIVPLLVVEDAEAAIDTVVRVETRTAVRRGVPAVHPVAARIAPAAEEAGP